MSVYINADQRLGLGVRTTLALTEIAEWERIRLDPKDLSALSEMVVQEILSRGERA